MNLKLKNHEERFYYNHSRFRGGGTAEVSVIADPNPQMKERSTTLNFSSTGGGGLVKTVNAVQAGVPWVMLSGILAGYDNDDSSFPKTTQITQENVSEENGILVLRVENTTGAPSNPYWFVFYSDNGNTFTLEANNVTYTFVKNGNIHALKMNSLEESHKFLQNFIFGSQVSEGGNFIKFNGIPIIKVMTV